MNPLVKLLENLTKPSNFELLPLTFKLFMAEVNSFKSKYPHFQTVVDTILFKHEIEEGINTTPIIVPYLFLRYPLLQNEFDYMLAFTSVNDFDKDEVSTYWTHTSDTSDIRANICAVLVATWIWHNHTNLIWHDYETICVNFQLRKGIFQCIQKDRDENVFIHSIKNLLSVASVPKTEFKQLYDAISGFSKPEKD